MHNLTVLQTVRIDIDSANIVGQCIDADNGRLLVLTDHFNIYQVPTGQLKDPELMQHSFNYKEHNLNRLDPDNVILIDFVVETGSVYIVLSSGEFLSIGLSSFSPPSQCLYKHKRSITSVKQSPDQDLIALADDNNDVFILSADFSFIHSSNALEHNDSLHKPVGVGWGSKETQFFGLDGRPSKEAQSKDKIILTEDELASIEKIESSQTFERFKKRLNRNTVLDWRGDGQYLASLTFIPATDKHYLKVWNRNLELQYMSDQLVTMQRGLLSWIPNGQYVCCVQRRDNRINEVALFEKNGMVRQRVSLPNFIPHLYIRNLLWSPDSKILAMVVMQFQLGQDSKVSCDHMIFLYTMQNFHYYLKYSHRLNNGTDDYSLRWNPVHHNLLYISSDDGKCVEYNCNLTVDRCLQDSTVVVTDANLIKLTPFDICNIPPPMSAVCLVMESLVSRILVGTNHINQMIVFTLDNKLVYTADNFQQDNGLLRIDSSIENPLINGFKENLCHFVSMNLEQNHSYQNLIPLQNQNLLATRQVKNNCDIILLDTSDKQQVKSILIKSFENNQIVTIVRDSFCEDSQTVTLLLDNGTCIQLNLVTAECATRFSFGDTSERLFLKEALYINSFNIVVTLTHDFTLRVNEMIVVANCCTSFKVTKNFMLYTTTENMMHIVPLDKLCTGQQISELGSWNQPIENGGSLVLANEDYSKVILQMPRGNLETLHPRILVLSRIMDYLDTCDHLNAMEMARKYRVDFNFLCDYLRGSTPKQLYETKINQFANDLAAHDPSLLNLFIAELSQEDTLSGRYKSSMIYMSTRSTQLEVHQTSANDIKVNKICSTIQLPEETRYLQPKLLCLLKQEPTKTDEALKLIHKLPSKAAKEETLKFILYFVQVDQLFLDAISTYSTDIALMVASVSRKDPKEYLALLDEFSSIEDVNMRKYMMDLHIKKYERAFDNLLGYLHDSPNKSITITKLLDLVVSKRIYKHAIKSCFDQFVNFIQMTDQQCRLETSFSRLSDEIWTKYGDYLLEKRYYLEAGLAYLKSVNTNSDEEEKKLDNVLKCFSLADDWERCVATIERFKLKSPKREDTLKKISQNLLSQGKHEAAAFVAVIQKNDDLAFQLASTGKWHLAETVVAECSRGKLHGSINLQIQIDLENLSSEIELEIEAARGQFERLQKVILTPQKSELFDADGNCFISDGLSTVDGSEATSVISGGWARSKLAKSGGAHSIKTRVSSKSSKSQANRKGKKINLKVGSRHEDMALAAELQKFVDGQKCRQESVKQLLSAQIEFSPSSSPPVSPMTINELLRDRFNLAQNIVNSFWPRNELDDNVYSLYKRFGKSLANAESVENTDIKPLMRPDLPTALSLLEF